MKRVNEFFSNVIPIEALVSAHAVFFFAISQDLHPVLTCGNVFLVTLTTLVVYKNPRWARKACLKWVVLAFLPLFFGLLFFLISSSFSGKFVTIPTIPREISLSVVVPARDESEFFLRNTVKYILMHTPAELLREIIILDDASSVPISSFFPYAKFPNVSIVRFEKRLGLIAVKIKGAQIASGMFLLFLDAHCRVTEGYAQLLLARAARAEYKDILVPVVVDMDGERFELTNQGGSKMMFDWSFEFNWIPDDEAASDDSVPITAGGIFLISRRGFLEGSYDKEMHEWGGENIEQSLRTWICGGKIYVERHVHIGHVFVRNVTAGTRSINPATVERNLARAAFVWLDDSIKYFSSRNTWARETLIDLGPGIEERLEIRHRLKCGKFKDYLDQFRPVFQRQGLLLEQEHGIQDFKSGLCIGVKQDSQDGLLRDPPVTLEWQLCDPYSAEQRFHPTGSHLRSARYERCLNFSVSFGFFFGICNYKNNGDLLVKYSGNRIIIEGHSIEAFLGKTEKYCPTTPVAAGNLVSASICGKHTADIHQIYIGL